MRTEIKTKDKGDDWIVYKFLETELNEDANFDLLIEELKNKELK